MRDLAKNMKDNAKLKLSGVDFYDAWLQLVARLEGPGQQGQEVHPVAGSHGLRDPSSFLEQ